MKTVTVKSGLTTDQVALWETHPDHPGGECFVAGVSAKPITVALTRKVLEALANGRLVEVTEPATTPEPDETVEVTEPVMALESNEVEPEPTPEPVEPLASPPPKGGRKK